MSRFVDSDLRRALGYVTPHWRRLALVVALSLVSTVAALYIPYLARLLIDRALLGRDATALATIILQFGVLTLGSFALNVVSGLVYTRTSADILFEMRLAVFRQLQRLSPRFYAELPIGQIATRINSDIGEIQRVAAEIALAWLGNVIFLVGSVVILVRLDRVLFLVSLAVLPAALWALVRYRSKMEVGRRRRPRPQRRRRQLSHRGAARHEGDRRVQRAGARSGAVPRQQRRVHRRADVDAQAHVSLGRRAGPAALGGQRLWCFSSAACA